MKSFEVFFDGQCPLCRREIDLVKWLGRGRGRDGRVVFTDISSPDFDPTTTGRTYAELMARIHGRHSESAEVIMIEGVDVFRSLYAAVGFGPLVALSRLPPLSWALEAGYAWFAKNRLRLTGRPSCEGQCLASRP